MQLVRVPIPDPFLHRDRSQREAIGVRRRTENPLVVVRDRVEALHDACRRSTTGLRHGVGNQVHAVVTHRGQHVGWLMTVTLLEASVETRELRVRRREPERRKG